VTAAAAPGTGVAPDRSIALIRRWAAPGAGLVAFALFAFLHATAPQTYDAALRWLGVDPGGRPFLDTTVILAEGQCFQAGVDVYRTDPCDPFNRLYDYAPPLLRLLPPGVSVDQTVAVGSAVALLFFLALATLPAPGSWRATAVTVAATLSSMTVYAVERGNADALILAVLLFALAAGGRAPIGRFVAYGAALFLGLVKFYPLSALILLLRERRRVAVALAGGAAALLVVFGLWYRDEIVLALGNVPANYRYADAFGASNLPAWLADFFRLLSDRIPAAQPFAFWVMPVLFGGFVVTALLRAQRFAASQPAGAFRALTQSEQACLVVGAALVSGCFLTGVSSYYRGIDLLPVLPGLFALARVSGTTFDARSAVHRTIGAILFLMWSEAIRKVIDVRLRELGLPVLPVEALYAAFWVVREIVWWQTIAVLLGVVLLFVAESDLGRRLAIDRLTAGRPLGSARPAV
jgi:hypothetical protein